MASAPAVSRSTAPDRSIPDVPGICPVKRDCPSENTCLSLLNDAGIKPDLLPYVCDAAPAKQGKLLPGSHIPIRPPAALRDDPPDEVLILPWNIAEEVKSQLADLAEQGVCFTTAVPRLNTC